MSEWSRRFHARPPCLSDVTHVLSVTCGSTVSCVKLVTEAVVEALTAHDLEAFVACYRVDAIIETGSGEVLASGHQAIRARYGPLLMSFPDVRVRKIEGFAVGEYIVQLEEVEVRGNLAPERHVAIYRIINGLIAHERLLR